jgi:hemerythrin-like domain-containing protein
METISSIFSANHRHCDEMFSRCEDHMQQHEWQQAKEVFTEFAREMEQHFSKEEDVLFPALVEQTGNAVGPTQVMRMEHKDMRQLMKDMHEDIEKQDDGHYLGLSETLLVMMQQHNMKEENILYQMADNVLATNQEEILTMARALRE